MHAKYFVIFFSLIIFSPCVLAAEVAVKQVETRLGKLSVEKNRQSNKCTISFSGKALLDWDCEFSYSPSVLGHFDKNVAPFDDVIVVQERPQGNACNGGPIRIIGLAKGNAPKLFKLIDFCGGADPVLTQVQNELKILFPGGPPNRGQGFIPDELWILKDGSISKASSARK